jgi:hypothetical protein
MSQKRIFVFGIGGTGSRVIRSLTMMLASGVKLNDVEKVIPIIIDLDIKNEDTNRTIRALDLYEDIRDVAYGKGAVVKEGFYSTDLSKLSSLRSEDAQGIVKESFLFDFGGIDSEFGDYLRLPSMDQIDQDFMKLLYDDSPAAAPETELRLRLSKGFKGNPNIGSVIFTQLKDSPEYKFFESSFKEGDRIFIVSSIFGGTGSSGFPQLLKILRKSKTNSCLKDSRIGAITVMPYFSVVADTASAIDSNRFISKTKAALSYYSNELETLSSMYYIYDQPGGNPYENNEGGEEQKNDAHLVEVISASAIIHFANQRDDQFGNTPDFYEFGLKVNEPVLDFRHFFDHTREELAIPLIHFTFFTQLFLKEIPKHLSDDLGKRLRLDEKFNSDAYYINIRKFINEHYLVWLKELGRNRRGFNPFNIEAEKFKDLLSGASIKTDFLCSDILNMSDIFKLEKSLQDIHKTPESRFMHCLYKWASDTRKKRLEKLPNL